MRSDTGNAKHMPTSQLLNMPGIAGNIQQGQRGKGTYAPVSTTTPVFSTSTLHVMSPGITAETSPRNNHQGYSDRRNYPGEPGQSQQRQSSTKESVDGWFAFVLLGIAVYSVTVAIIQANWVMHSMVLLLSPIVGLLLGVLVAKIQRFPQSVLHLTACLLGHWLAVLLTSVFAFHVPWLSVLMSLRAVVTGGLGSTGVPDGEEMIFFFYLAFLCFFLGYFGSWLVYRARLPWLVAFVYCSIMLVNLNYVKQDLLLLFLVLLCSLLLLIARVHLSAQVAQWQREGLRTDAAWIQNITGHCMQVASVLTLIMLLLSPLLPVLQQTQGGVDFWNALDNTWTNVLNGHVSLQNIGSITQTYQPPTNFFGDKLMITGSVQLPTGEVLTYTSSSGPQYLEGFTYNQFDGHTWTSSVDPASMQAFGPNEQIPQDVQNPIYSSINTTVTLTHPPQETKPYIFGPAQPTQFDVATAVYGNGGIATAWTQQGPLVINEQYHVVSSVLPNDPKLYQGISLPSEDEGQWTSDSNNDILSNMYLRVPSDLTPTVQRTLKSWTGGATDAYDALAAIQAHLSDQNSFTYSVDNAPVPVNVDAVDWILTTHKGYCTYYATAMSIMGRMLGIPTRVVSGFSQGHFDAKRKVWVVNGTDAHSWVQAYMPGFGWLTFDPTPGFAPTIVQSSPTPPPAVTKTPTHPAPTTTPASKKPLIPPPSNTGGSHSGPLANSSLLLDFSMTTLLLSLLFLVAAVLSYWWRTLYSNSTFVAGMFWRLCYLARFLGLGPRRWQTPYEYSEALSKYAPQQATMLYQLAHLFVRDRWGSPQQAPHPQEIEAAQKLWPSFWRMLGTVFLQRMKRK